MDIGRMNDINTKNAQESSIASKDLLNLEVADMNVDDPMNKTSMSEDTECTNNKVTDKNTCKNLLSVTLNDPLDKRYLNKGLKRSANLAKAISFKFKSLFYVNSSEEDSDSELDSDDLMELKNLGSDYGSTSRSKGIA